MASFGRASNGDELCVADRGDSQQLGRDVAVNVYEGEWHALALANGEQLRAELLL